MQIERSFDGGVTWSPLAMKDLRTINRIARVCHDSMVLDLAAGAVFDCREFGWVRAVRQVVKKKPLPNLTLF